MIHMINGAAYRKLIIQAAAAIELSKQPINELNVFPVPDGDTGTNMSMTLNAAVPELQRLSSPTLTKVADTVAAALLRGARGNSGVILSLLFRGMSKAMKGAESCDGALWARAITAGVETAYKAVMKPAEGTILTVSRLAAAAATEAVTECGDFEQILQVTIDAAKAALANTVDQNPVLQKAGVVDAGGKGWIVILEAMLNALRGDELETPEVLSAQAVKEQADFADFNTEDIKFQYCTEFIVSRENEKDPDDLRVFLGQLGDSLVLVDDDDIIKVHVHTNNPGVALEEALKYGSFVTVKIENMKLQHTQKVLDAAEAITEAVIAAPEKDFGVVAVCAGEGLATVFRELGADGIVSGGQTMNPSTQDILTQINQISAKTVFVFPNNKNIIMAAKQAIGLTEKNVVVIPSKTIPQGISALLSFDPTAGESENTQAMCDALQTVTTIQITYASRDSDFDGHDIHAGDYLALYGSALFDASPDLNHLLCQLAERLHREGREYITVYYGQDVDEIAAEGVREAFAEFCPDADIALVDGGQPVYSYLISAE